MQKSDSLTMDSTRRTPLEKRINNRTRANGLYLSPHRTKSIKLLCVSTEMKKGTKKTGFGLGESPCGTLTGSRRVTKYTPLGANGTSQYNTSPCGSNDRKNLRVNTFEEEALKANEWCMETGSCCYCVRPCGEFLASH